MVGGRFARDTLVAEGIPPEKIRVNPYGVDWAAFAPPAGAGAAARPFRFLYVGSVIARKGVPVLLEAWRQFAPKDAELWIAGGIGPRERRLIPELPGLRLLGQVPRAEIPALYAQADMLCCPSLFEGFGLVLLEALRRQPADRPRPSTGAEDLLQNRFEPGGTRRPGSVDELVGRPATLAGRSRAGIAPKILAARAAGRARIQLGSLRRPLGETMLKRRNQLTMLAIITSPSHPIPGAPTSGGGARGRRRQLPEVMVPDAACRANFAGS